VPLPARPPGGRSSTRPAATIASARPKT